MSFADVLITVFEVVMVATVFWCIFHEDRLVAFEEKVLSAIRRKRLRVVKTEQRRIYNQL